VTRATGDVVGPVPEGQDPEAYDRLRRRILWSLPTGLYLLGSRAGNRRNLMTISWVTQVALEPKLLGVGVEGAARTHELLVDGGVFTLNLLPRSERALVRGFAKPVEDSDFDEDTGRGTMNGVAVGRATTGAPVVDRAAAWLDCEVRHTLPLGSHTWFVGEVVDAGAHRELPGTDDQGILRMEDTRMNYGG
jgi:flavin reductase (DIM6/NTAB) family NADH-FMN oxidoreductase RutF